MSKLSPRVYRANLKNRSQLCCWPDCNYQNRSGKRTSPGMMATRCNSAVRARHGVHRGISFLLAVLLIISGFPVLPGQKENFAFADSQSPLTWAEFETGQNAVNGVDYTTAAAIDGSEKTINIYTALGLAWLSNVVNDESGNVRYDPFADGNHSLIDVNITLSPSGVLSLATTSAFTWEPIGKGRTESNTFAFSGNFDGNGCAISDLNISTSGLDYQGLFGYVSGASIENLSLDHVVIHSAQNESYEGGYEIGSLAGHCTNSTISAITANGSVEGYSEVGGLIGRSIGGRTQSCSTDVTVSGMKHVGGLIGSNGFREEGGGSGVSGCSAAGIVTSGNVGGETRAGGLIGYNIGAEITSSYAIGAVTGTGNYVGGLLGMNGDNLGGMGAPGETGISGGSISYCYAEGSVNAGNGSNSASVAGGLIGYQFGTDIRVSYAIGDVKAYGFGAGGLAGSVSASIVSNSYATGAVSAEDTDNGNSYSGGLIGDAFESSRITSCYAMGTATGPGSGVGGLIGVVSPDSTVSGCFSGNLSTDSAVYIDEGWDFNTIWRMGDGSGYLYPVFLWRFGQPQSEQSSQPPATEENDHPAESTHIDIHPTNMQISPMFLDMEGHWAQSTVQNMLDRMILKGVEEGLFAPDQPITRGEFVSILVNALAIKGTRGESFFTDVVEDHIFYQEINIAKEHGLISGYPDQTFRPEQTITREEAMVILARCSYSENHENSMELLSMYQDRSLISEWSLESALLCLKHRIFIGSDGLLKPQSLLTRAEAVTVIDRIIVLRSSLSSVAPNSRGFVKNSDGK